MNLSDLLGGWQLKLAAGFVGLTLVAGLLFWFSEHFIEVGVQRERAVWEQRTSAATASDLVDLKLAVEDSARIASRLNETLSKQGSQRVIDRGVIEREIRTDVRYRNICLPDSGLRAWNQLSAGGTLLPDQRAGLKLDGTLPGTDVVPAR